MIQSRIASAKFVAREDRAIATKPLVIPRGFRASTLYANHTGLMVQYRWMRSAACMISLWMWGANGQR